MRNTPNDFENTYQECLKMCEDYEIHILDVKKRKVSSKIDTPKNNQNQHYFEKKSDEIRVTVFYTNLDKLINGIDSRFNQESLQIISTIGNMVKLKNSESISYKCLKEKFDICEDDLSAEMKLLKNMSDIPSGTSVQTIHDWLDWLQHSSKIDIFSNFYKALQLFVTIPVTSCSCERCFSKLNIVKSKLRSTMTQTRLTKLDSIMLLFVEQEKTNSVNIDDVIEEFKTLNDTTRRMVL
jgi:hypothetical protein